MKKYILPVLLLALSFTSVQAQAAPTTSSSCTDLPYNLGYGSNDRYTQGGVTRLQNFLNANGFLKAPSSGFFGNGTVSAVKDFQAAKGLNRSGYVGQQTRDLIKSMTCGGSGVGATSGAVWSTFLATPTLVSTSPVSQFVTGGSNFGIATFRVRTAQSGVQTTVRELRFSTTGTDAIQSITVGGITAPVVGSGLGATTTISGLNIPVTSNGADIPVTVKFSGFQNTTSGGFLIADVPDVKVTLGYVEAVDSTSGRVIYNASAVSSNTFTLVASKPSVTVGSGGQNSLVLGAENKIGEFTVSADANGKIGMRTLVLLLSTIGITNPSFLSPRITDGNTVVTLSDISVSGGGTVNIAFPFAYEIQAGQSKTFSLYATVKGTQTSGTIVPSVSSRFAPSNSFAWTDILGGNIPQMSDNIPTNSYTTSRSGSSVAAPTVTASEPVIKIEASSANKTNNSALSVNIGDTFTVSGAPQNIQGLSYYSGNGYPTTGYYSRAFFFDQNFGNNNVCGNNDAATNAVWTMTCTAKVSGSSNFYIEIYANGQVYKSNVVNVTVNPSTAVVTPSTPMDLSDTTMYVMRMSAGLVPTDMRYDIDGDGRITSADAIAYSKVTSMPDVATYKDIAKYVLKMAVGLFPKDLKYDLNKDGRISSADALAYERLSIPVVPTVSPTTPSAQTPSPVTSYPTPTNSPTVPTTQTQVIPQSSPVSTPSAMPDLYGYYYLDYNASRNDLNSLASYTNFGSAQSVEQVPLLVSKGFKNIMYVALISDSLQKLLASEGINANGGVGSTYDFRTIPNYESKMLAVYKEDLMALKNKLAANGTLGNVTVFFTVDEPALHRNYIPNQAFLENVEKTFKTVFPDKKSTMAFAEDPASSASFPFRGAHMNPPTTLDVVTVDPYFFGKNTIGCSQSEIKKFLYTDNPNSTIGWAKQFGKPVYVAADAMIINGSALPECYYKETYNIVKGDSQIKGLIWFMYDSSFGDDVSKGTSVNPSLINLIKGFTTVPTVTLNNFVPSTIEVGKNSIISFTSTNADTCIGTGTGPNGQALWNGNLGGTYTPAGGKSTANLYPSGMSAGIYSQTITCTGLGGSATSETKVLTVVPKLTMAAGSSNSRVLGAYATGVCTNLPYNIHRGNESSSTRNLQSFLITKGLLDGNATGFYGDKTVEAVKAYQASNDLPTTGMVYSFTREAIRAESCQ
ncbi:MAG: peptidoglycan-binding protein [Candidatus Paceibacterota bacterium]